MSACPSCGSESEGAFCGHCGARLAPAEIGRPPRTPFVTRVPGPIPEGTPIVVAAGDSFLGLRYGSCVASLDAGRHEAPEELDEGFYVLASGVELAFEEPLGVREDQHGTRADLSIEGTIRLRVDEPRDCVVALAERGGALDVPALSERVRGKLRELVDEEIRDLLAQDRYLSALPSKRATDAIRAAAHEAWAVDAERDPWLAMEVVKLHVRVTPIASPPSRELPVVQPILANGTQVEVEWPDGGKYTGVVRAAAYQIVFDDGQERWVPVETVREKQA